VNQSPENTKEQKHKRKKLPLFVVLMLAATGFFLARGVAAGTANDITLNGATAMMGGDEIAANACDTTMTITRTPVFYTGTNKFRIERVTISGVNQYAPAVATSTIGVEGCGNQVLNMAIYNGSLAGASQLQQASWTIPSVAITNGSFYFDYDVNKAVGGSYYADVLLLPFAPDQDINTKYAVRTYRTPY
jgi:hypothetical protein